MPHAQRPPPLLATHRPAVMNRSRCRRLSGHGATPRREQVRVASQRPQAAAVGLRGPGVARVRGGEPWPVGAHLYPRTQRQLHPPLPSHRAGAAALYRLPRPHLGLRRLPKRSASTQAQPSSSHGLTPPRASARSGERSRAPKRLLRHRLLGSRAHLHRVRHARRHRGGHAPHAPSGAEQVGGSHQVRHDCRGHPVEGGRVHAGAATRDVSPG